VNDELFWESGQHSTNGRSLFSPMELADHLTMPDTEKRHHFSPLLISRPKRFSGQSWSTFHCDSWAADRRLDPKKSGHKEE
jgi:hypothetical protein